MRAGPIAAYDVGAIAPQANVIRLDESRPHCGESLAKKDYPKLDVIRLDESRPHCGKLRHLLLIASDLRPPGSAEWGEAGAFGDEGPWLVRSVGGGRLREETPRVAGRSLRLL